MNLEAIKAMEAEARDVVAFVVKAHDGQTDHAGNAYSLHPLAVASLIAEHVRDASIDLFLSGLGHDLKDDTKTTAKQMIDAGFTPRSVDLVDSVSNNFFAEGLTYQQKIDIIISSGDVEPMLLKLFDNTHNIDPKRGSSEKTERLREKRYIPSIRKLVKALRLAGVEFTLPDHVMVVLEEG